MRAVQAAGTGDGPGVPLLGEELGRSGARVPAVTSGLSVWASVRGLECSYWSQGKRRQQGQEETSF